MEPQEAEAGKPTQQWRSKLTKRPLFTAVLSEGTAVDSTGHSTVLWPAELLSHLRETIQEEAGPAWRRVWKDCGREWGRRIMDDLEKRCGDLLGCTLEDLPLETFLEFVTEQVTAQGWGRLEVDLSQGPERGLIRATLKNSILGSEGDGSGDVLLAGLLASVLSRVSGEALDCVRAPGAAAEARFFITAGERLAGVEARIEAGEDAERIFEKI